MNSRHLREDFLAPYRAKGDNFPDLLARSTYLSKYSRGEESWTDTCVRVVDANCDLEPNVSVEERELLFHVIWTMQGLPPGRGLWVGGVEGIPADARYNCWYTTIYDNKDWGWIANQLMLGGGVGAGLWDIHNLPTVLGDRGAPFEVVCNQEHPNWQEVLPDVTPGITPYIPPAHMVQDSREGWVDALNAVTTNAYAGRGLFLDVSSIRPRGAPIKTFGGTACGPGPLVELLRSAWSIIRGAVGRKLSSVEALDVTNYIGKCIKAGNVRRSALIVLGRPDDQEFRDAKKDWDAVLSHRHTSNNSIVFQREAEFAKFDWRGLAQDNIEFGEPGVANLWRARLTDPGAQGVNPCGEQFLHDREACNLAEVFPANFDGSVAPDKIFRLMARYCLRQRLTPLLDGQSNTVGQRNMRVGVGLGGICDFDWTEDLLKGWFNIVREEANHYADALGVARPITTTTVKPSGTISLLNDSSPGLHAPHSEYYIRRTRHAANDPLVPALMEAGVPWEHDQYDSSGRTLCFSFPTKAKHTRVTSKSQTLRQQFERQLAVQNSWADNAVSCTINFDKNKPAELAACMAEFIPQLKSTSCLPSVHGYAQAPYEEITQHTFESLSRGIDFDAKLTRGGTFDIEECAGGACPVR